MKDHCGNWPLPHHLNEVRVAHWLESKGQEVMGYPFVRKDRRGTVLVSFSASILAR